MTLSQSGKVALHKIKTKCVREEKKIPKQSNRSENYNCARGLSLKASYINTPMLSIIIRLCEALIYY